MSLLPVSAIPSADVAYNINNSLRFRRSANASLSRTPSTAGNRQTWTWSSWIKRGILGTTQTIFAGATTLGDVVYFTSSDTLAFYSDGLGSVNQRNSTQVFRDSSAWYHIVVTLDTTNATAQNRCRMWVNGSEITSWTTNATITQNYQGYINNTITHQIFSNPTVSDQFCDGYLAEVNFIDGQALTPTSFGETNATTGVWQPKAYTGTYGTNGFYQKYSNAGSSAVLVNTTSAVQDTAATTITVNVPSNTANGNLMILIVASSGTSNNWTTPAGWTVWSSNFNGRAIYYRTASSEPASYTVTQSGSATSSAYILTYNNATIDVMGSTGVAGNPSVAPSITTTANNATVFYFVASGAQDTNTYSTPTNFTPLVSDLGPTRPCSAVFSRVQATAGATGTASSTIGTGNPISQQFSIKTISNTNLGLDFSGNGNNWTTNNISVTAGATYDAMTDSPTLTSATVSNYCTANPLDASPSGTSVISNGNLTVNVSGSSAGGGFGGQARCNTINFTNVSGKWYWEAFIDNAGTGAATLRLTFFMAAEPINISAQGGPWTWYWRADGLTDLTSAGTFATNDVVMFAYDSNSGKLWVGKNGTWSNSGVPSAGTGQVRTITALAAYALGLNYGTSGGGTGTASFNFGQRPFAYTPPTGFLALNTFNLPNSTIVKGNSFMDATLYTGTGASRSVTNAAAFRPDFVWVKGRSGATDHALYDAVRGVQRQLESNTTTNETTETTGLTAFNSNGFTVGALAQMNTNAATYVAWQWQAGSSTVTNTSGTISSQVRANTTTGFSIVTYTGVGANRTVGHGLGVAPKMIIVKNYDSAVFNWVVYHSGVPATQFLALSSNAAATTSAVVWNNTAPTSTVFSVGTGTSANGNGNRILAYCWAEIEGFSRFGSYTGNGSTDGPFVYLGFRPKFVMVKNSSVASDWVIIDSSRDTFNVAPSILQPNLNNAQSTGTTTSSIMDLLSNGFKMRGSGGSGNGNGNTIIYAAFAENPFKNSLAR